MSRRARASVGMVRENNDEKGAERWQKTGVDGGACDNDKGGRNGGKREAMMRVMGGEEAIKNRGDWQQTHTKRRKQENPRHNYVTGHNHRVACDHRGRTWANEQKKERSSLLTN